MNQKTKFAGTFLSDDIENNKRLFYSWNEYSPIKIMGSNSTLLGLFMRIKINDKVYFVTDNKSVEAFINASGVYHSNFFLTEDIDATEFSEETINNYFQLIS